MNDFVQWEMLRDFATLASIVLTVTQFTKNIKFIEKIPTKYWSYIIAFVLILLVNIQNNSFNPLDIVLYALSAMFVSTSANGIYSVGTKKENKPQTSVETAEVSETNK